MPRPAHSANVAPRLVCSVTWQPVNGRLSNAPTTLVISGRRCRLRADGLREADLKQHNGTLPATIRRWSGGTVSPDGSEEETMMRHVVDRLADLLLSKVVAQTTAGACPCGDCFLGLCGTDHCAWNQMPRYCTSCDCTQTRHTGCVYCACGC